VGIDFVDGIGVRRFIREVEIGLTKNALKLKLARGRTNLIS